MRIERCKDILDHARAFHRLIAQCYHRLGNNHATQEGHLGMVLDYLETHEKHLEENLLGYEDQAAPKVLDHWFRLSPCEAKLDELKGILEKDRVSERDVIALAMEVDDCMIDMYKHVARNAEDEDVRTLFQALMTLEENERRRMARDMLYCHDL